MSLNKTIVAMAGFAVLAIALGFANGRVIIPGLIWIVPGLLLALLRASRPRIAFSGLFLTGLIAGGLQWNGVVPLAPALSVLAACVLGVVLLTPFALDRLLHDRLPPWAAFLLFPVAQVSLELGTSVVLPYASFGAWAYTQTAFPPVFQSASLLGFWSVSFVIACAASGLAALLVARKRRSLAVPIGASALVVGALVFGFVRLAAEPGQTTPLTVVGIASKPSDFTNIIAVKGGCGADDCAAARADAKTHVGAMFARSELAVREGGAKLILWSEVAAPLFPDDLAPFLARAESFARENSIYFAPAFFVVEPARPPWRNEVYLFDPNGARIAMHLKAKPVPGEISVNGPDTVAMAQTNVGAIAMAICYDMDFPWLARKGAGARLMLAPGSDWAAIDPLHPNMVAMRAVENGYAVVRPSRESASVAFDPYGRELARTEWRGVERPTVRATIRTAPVATLYARIGDVFAYFCAAVLAALIGWALIRSPRAREERMRPQAIQQPQSNV